MAKEIDTTEIAIAAPQVKTTSKTTQTMGAKLKKPLLNKLHKMDASELRHLVADMQSKLDQVQDTNVHLRVQLANAVEERDILKKKADEAELKHIYDQLLYDTRIMELNQIIMERERRIIDLQQAFSEQGQLDAPPRERKDVGMTTDDSGGAAGGARAATGASRWTTPTKRDGCSSRARRPQRNASPGRAIPQLLRAGGANGSPPPLDPTDEDGCSSYTTTDNLLLGAMDIGGGDSKQQPERDSRGRYTPKGKKKIKPWCSFLQAQRRQKGR